MDAEKEETTWRRTVGMTPAIDRMGNRRTSKNWQNRITKLAGSLMCQLKALTWSGWRQITSRKGENRRKYSVRMCVTKRGEHQYTHGTKGKIGTFSRMSDQANAMLRIIVKSNVNPCMVGLGWHLSWHWTLFMHFILPMWVRFKEEEDGTKVNLREGPYHSCVQSKKVTFYLVGMKFPQ